MLKGIDDTLSSKLDFVCFKVCVHISPCSCYGDRHDGVVVAPSFPLSLFLSLFNPGVFRLSFPAHQGGRGRDRGVE